MTIYRILLPLAIVALLLAFGWWQERQAMRDGAEAWRNLRAGLRWDSHHLQRDTVRLLTIRNHNRR